MNKKRPLVSIIIPVYNTGNRLERCIASALSQKLKEFEIILIDDGSTDNSGEIIKEYAQKDDRIRAIFQENMGPGKARNKGIQHASGEYMYFMDSDDQIEPTLLDQNVRKAKEFEVDIVIFGYKKVEKSNSQNRIEVNTRLEESYLPTKESIKANLVDVLEAGGTFAVWNKLFKSSLIATNNLSYPDMKRNQDMIFTISALSKAQSVYVNPGIYYTYKFDSLRAKYDKNLIKHHLLVFDQFYTMFDDWMMKLKNKNYAAKLFILYFFHSVPFFIVSYDPNPKIKLKEMFSNDLFLNYKNKLQTCIGNGKVLNSAMFILKMKSPTILMVVTKLKIMFTKYFGKNLLRNLLNYTSK